MDVTRAVELYAQGVSMRVIADELGVAESTVSRKLRNAGVKTRPGTNRAPVADSQIIRLRMEGMLWREIAAVVGMTKNGVHARYRRVKLTGRL